MPRNVIRAEVEKKGSIVFFFKQKTAYEISLGLVGSEMCIRDSVTTGVSKVREVDQ